MLRRGMVTAMLIAAVFLGVLMCLFTWDLPGANSDSVTAPQPIVVHMNIQNLVDAGYIGK